MTEVKICPYPGLRPFTEAESIFFKGRDKHIKQIKSQLEERKFLMLTGASGDGKSSVVYAGVIPEARAGFFKASFNNWVITHFRPERSPLTNLAKALSNQLKIEIDKVEKELSFGFSAIINLYKSSEYYLDQTADEWLNADEEGKRKLKSKAANLFILVDQFEEFFTNTENYSNGKPSKQSQITVNLILETAKIALAEDLPIYIICTMRSDYIGHCAAFKGLPENIGYSQFFVPRLNRKEVYQIIEEPAELGGTKVAHRVIEVLINELSDGFDQLPVLQHALNNLWNMADKGEKEIDLIHLAQIAGISSQLLPPEDSNAFDTWLDALPEFKKKYFEEPSISNILAAHANELYEEDHSTEVISQPDAQRVIKLTFQCLTKIDANRAVRNRMTLREITDIINRPNLNSEAVASILYVFRKQGNTFISPFVSDDKEKTALAEDTVLEITHESLIRNWDLLKQWADEEYANWHNFQDFNKQLQRWVDSEKSNGYLLPIGPLTFFEKWYNKKNPNKYWLARYDERDISLEEKLEEAEEILNNAREFIKKSARNLYFSRTIIKYGANRIANIFALVALICTCTYYYFDYNLKLNDNVIAEIQEKGIGLLTSRNVGVKAKAQFLINSERLNSGSFTRILENLKNDSLAFDIAIEMFKLAENYNDPDKKVVNRIAEDIFHYLHMLLTDILNKGVIIDKSGNKFGSIEEEERFVRYKAEQDTGSFTTAGAISENSLRNLNQFLTLCYFMKLHDYESFVSEAIVASTNRLYDAVDHILSWESKATTYEEAMDIYEKRQLAYEKKNEKWKIEFENWKNNLRDTKPTHPEQPTKPRKRNFEHNQGIIKNVSAFNQSIELLIASSDILGIEKIKEITSKISPFGNEKARIIFDKIYSKEKRWRVSNRNSHFLTHNGGYQILAYLNAVEGNYENIDRCLDSIILYNNDYKKYDNENFYMIFHYLTKFDHYPSFKTEELIDKYRSYSGLSRLKIIEKICKRNFYSKISSFYIKGGTRDVHFGNIIPFLISDDQKDKGWDEYGSATGKQMAEFANLPAWITRSFGDEINFNFAMYYKKRGIYTLLGISELKGTDDEDLTRKRSNDSFKRAFEYYSKISDDFLDQDFVIGWADDPMSKKIKYSDLFLYPGIIREDDTKNPYTLQSFVQNPFPFFDYMLKNSSCIEYYKSQTDYEAIERFLYEYYDAYKLNSNSTIKKINFKYFDFAKKLVVKDHLARQTIDIDFMHLVKFIRYFDRGVLPKFDAGPNKDINVPEIRDSHEFQNRPAPYGKVNKELLRLLATHFALTNRFDKSMQMLKIFIDDYTKRNTVIDITFGLQKSGPVENTFEYLDLIFDDIENGDKFGLKLIKVLSMIGSQRMYDLSLKLIKDQDAQRKGRAINNLVWGVAYNGYYYKAYKFIPDYISSNDELELYNQILYTEIIQNRENNFTESREIYGWKSFDKKNYHDDHWMDYEAKTLDNAYLRMTLNIDD